MMFTVHTSYKSNRLYVRTDKIEADSKETAKAIAWERILADHPNALLDSHNARKSSRKGGLMA